MKALTFLSPRTGYLGIHFSFIIQKQIFCTVYSIESIVKVFQCVGHKQEDNPFNPMAYLHYFDCQPYVMVWRGMPP